ncbi:MAG: E3 binding domain-containing protein [Anaerolineales bacterium]|nr:E3 binding domain-containing protein [Anaerolineales bacterium]
MDRKQKPKRKKSLRLNNPADAAPVAQTSAPADGGPVKASPLARKVAKDNGVNLASVQGSGPGGRVVRKDIEAALSSGQSSVTSKQSVQPITNYQLPVSTEDKAIPTTKLRQAIGRRLVESKQTIPHFYVTHEYKMEAVMDMRKQINAYLPDNEKSPSTTSSSKPPR